MSLQKIIQSSVCLFITAVAAEDATSCTFTRTKGDGASINELAYHYDAQRTGWNDRENQLTPENLITGKVWLLWESLPLDYYEGMPPRLFATPLYVASVTVSGGAYLSRTLSLLYVVTLTGYAYAVNAVPNKEVAGGAIIWRKELTHNPCYTGTAGIFSTPIINLSSQLLYVTSCDEDLRWQVHALYIRNGEERLRWQVSLTGATINRTGINKNGDSQYDERNANVQRGALALSPDSSRLYVSFGSDSG